MLILVASFLCLLAVGVGLITLFVYVLQLACDSVVGIVSEVPRALREYRTRHRKRIDRYRL